MFGSSRFMVIIVMMTSQLCIYLQLHQTVYVIMCSLLHVMLIMPQ